MIFLLVLLDVLVGNYTIYTSYFFLVYLYNKSYKYYLLTGLILDLIIFHNTLYNTIILSIMYLLNRVFKDLNKKNFYNYLFILTFDYLIYIILSNVINYSTIPHILTNIGLHLIINLIFYILSFRVIKFAKTS